MGSVANWERLVRATLRRERIGAGVYGQPVSGIAGNVSRILCEHAYSVAQNLDPNSEGRVVLQFKTGLMSVIRQKLAKREGGAIDRSQDITRLQEFYKRYREKNKVDELRDDEMKLRESGVFSDLSGDDGWASIQSF